MNNDGHTDDVGEVGQSAGTAADHIADAISRSSKNVIEFLQELRPTGNNIDDVATSFNQVAQAAMRAAEPPLDPRQPYSDFAATAFELGTKALELFSQVSKNPAVGTRRDAFMGELAEAVRSVSMNLVDVANQAVPAAGSGPAANRIRSIQLDLRLVEPEWIATDGKIWVRNVRGANGVNQHVTLCSTPLLGPNGDAGGAVFFNGDPTSIELDLDGTKSEAVRLGVAVAADNHNRATMSRYYAVIRVVRHRPVGGQPLPPVAELGPDDDTCIMLTAITVPEPPPAPATPS